MLKCSLKQEKAFVNSYFFSDSVRKRHMTSLLSATALPISYPTTHDFCVTSATMTNIGREILHVPTL